MIASHAPLMRRACERFNAIILCATPHHCVYTTTTPTLAMHWRFFDESTQAAKRFATFTQIVVVAIKRPAPLLRVPDEVRPRLHGWRRDAERGWAGAAPDMLPVIAIPAPYQVPSTVCQPAGL